MYTALTAPGVPIPCTFIARRDTWHRNPAFGVGRRISPKPMPPVHHTGTGRPSAVSFVFPRVLRVFPADGMYTELTAPGVPVLCTFIVRPVTRYRNRPSPRTRNGSDILAGRSPGLGGHLPDWSCSPKYCPSFRQMECTQNWHPRERSIPCTFIVRSVPRSRVARPGSGPGG